MDLFATLLLAHLLGDFPLQTNLIFKLKNQGSAGIALHVVIHVIITALFIPAFWRYGSVLAILAIAHFTTDWLKLRYPGRRQVPGFVADQIVHWATLLLITLWKPELPTLLPPSVLYSALVMALIPAFLTFFWVWANDLRHQTSQPRHLISWASQNLLVVSQKFGYFLMVFITTSGLILIA